jgi:hypothetical protein
MYKTIKNCRCCNSSNLSCVIDFGKQPLANSYHDGQNKLPEYPLALNLCKNCFHSQLNIVVDPDEMFKNYVYISGTSKTLNTFFESFADMVISETVLQGTVLDIACNDGTQLEKFKKRGWITHGIDPAENLYNLSSKINDRIIVDYLSNGALEKLGFKKYDAIIAQNVFAHTDNIFEFLNCCKKVMSEKTKLYIQTSQADMIENNQFDTIYHEHLSFFSTKSMQTICQRTGLKLIDVKRLDIHGVSYLFTVKLTGEENTSIQESILKEKNAGRYKLKTYKNYSKNIKNIIKSFSTLVKNYKKNGYLVVGYGAAAKGNTFLNASKTKMHYIIDDNQLKCGLLCPGSNAPILSPDTIKLFGNNTIFIPLAWNFYSEIKNKIYSEVIKLPFKKLFDYEIHSYYPVPKTEKI